MNTDSSFKEEFEVGAAHAKCFVKIYILNPS
jgi:hypothetical protein